MQYRYLSVGSVTALSTIGPWIAAKKARQVESEFLRCRSGHAIRRIGGTGHRQLTCKATRQEKECSFNKVYKEILYPKKSRNNWTRDLEFMMAESKDRN
jgi:hypothetical protein